MAKASSTQKAESSKGVGSVAKPRKTQNSNPYDNLALIWMVLRDHATPERPLTAGQVYNHLKASQEAYPSAQTVSNLLTTQHETMGFLFGRAVIPSQAAVQKILREQSYGDKKDTGPLALTCTAKTGKVSAPHQDYDQVCARKAASKAEGDPVLDEDATLSGQAMPTRYYHLASPLTQGEWRIFGDLVRFSPFISPSQTHKFLKVLHGLSGITLVAKDPAYAFKREHNTLFDIIHVLHQALVERKKVHIFYGTHILQRTDQRTLAPRLVKRAKNSDLTLAPQSLLWANGFYYLVARHETYGLMHLRVDRILSVTLTGEVFQPDSGFSAALLRDHAPAMYGGAPKPVTFSCPERFLNTVMDFFGATPQYTLEGDTMRVTVQASLIGAKLFALQYLDTVTVLDPPELRQQLAESLAKGASKY